MTDKTHHLRDPKTGETKPFKVRNITERILAARKKRDEERKALKQRLYGKPENGKPAAPAPEKKGS